MARLLEQSHLLIRLLRRIEVRSMLRRRAYRPERHYMRGAGPAYRAKHAG